MGCCSSRLLPHLLVCNVHAGMRQDLRYLFYSCQFPKAQLQQPRFSHDSVRTQVGAVHAVVEGRLELRLSLQIGESHNTLTGCDHRQVYLLESIQQDTWAAACR